MNDKPAPGVRVQTAEDHAKAFKQYDQLRRGGRVRQALIVTRMDDGSWHVLMQKGRPDDVMAAVWVVVKAMEAVEEKTNRIALPDELVQPLPDDGSNPARAFKIGSAITRAADGSLQAPPGETFVHCGECGRATWFVLGDLHTDAIARTCCTHCGNELKLHRVTVPEGRA